MSTKITFETFDADGCETVLEIEAKYVVCPRCQGEGKHVNPAVDGNGLTAEDFNEAGPEFFEAYMAGVYDVTCHECGGKRVVAVVDRSKADAETLRLYDEHEQELADLAHEEYMERRYCGEY